MPSKWIYVNTKTQQLFLYQDEAVIAQYPVSTAKNGLGEIEGSEKTPRGWHCIEKKIGEGLPVNAVFRARVATGEIYSSKLASEFPERDWILTRIMWLSGLEVSKNKGGNVDTFSRYIYIHGCPDQVVFDQPSSHGCVRMHNHELLLLFKAVDEKTPVYIGDALPTDFREYLR